METVEPDGLLYTTVLNLAKDELRKMIRSPTIPYDDQIGTDSAQSSVHEVEQIAIQKETRAAVTTAIDSLPSHYSAAISLVGLQGQSYKEAAEILQVPVGTIKSRVKRAKGFLKKTLSPDIFIEKPKNTSILKLLSVSTAILPTDLGFRV